MSDSEARGRAGFSPVRGRAAAIVAAVLGLFVATAVIGYFNFGAVLAAIRPIGAGGFLAAIVAQAVLFVPLGLAWWFAAPSGTGRATALMWGRLTREAAADVLPFSQFGGIAIAARVAVLSGVASTAAFGSIVVDITFEMIAQLVYTLIGLAILVRHLGFGTGHDRLLAPLVAGLIGGVVMVCGFIATQRRGFQLIEKMLERMLPAIAGHASAVTQVVEAVWGKPLRLWACLGLHIFSWFGSAAGTWLILRFIDHPLPYLSVVAIESVLYAVRNAAFIVPSGLGVQEGAYALLGPLFGLPAEAALALSLLKRARDIVIGVPLLLIWQFMESRRALPGAG